MKLKLIFAFIVFFVFLLINLTPINLFFPRDQPKRYLSEDGLNEQWELGKRKDPWRDVSEGMLAYKAIPGNAEIKYYRCIKRDWLQVWNWLDFIFHPRWKVPYKACPITDRYQWYLDLDAKAQEANRRKKELKANE